jgi:hypothetical protein
MPTDREREYYRMGFRDGSDQASVSGFGLRGPSKSNLIKQPKRKISDWQKFVKANSKKRVFKYRDGKLNLKKMGVAYRKTAAYKRNKKR